MPQYGESRNFGGVTGNVTKYWNGRNWQDGKVGNFVNPAGGPTINPVQSTNAAPAPVRQAEIKPPAETLDTVVPFERVSFNKNYSFKRETGLGNESGYNIAFPDKLHAGGIPFIKFDVFEINTTNPGVTSTVTSPSQASIAAGLKQSTSVALNAASALVKKGGEIAQAVLPNKVTEIAENAAETVNKTAVQVGINPEELKQKIVGLFQDFSLSRYSDTRVASIALPIPDGLQTQYSQDYGELSLTKELGVIGFAAQAIAEPQFLDRNDPYLTELGTTLGNRFLNTSEEMTNLLQFGASGRVVNPQMEMLYKSPRFRDFTFDFRLIPRNQSDAENIYQIVKHLKYYSSPTFCGTTTGRYYVPPARFAFSFFNGDGSFNDNLFRSKQCVMTNISVDYAPNGYATHSDGFPVEIRLQIQLKETAMITAEDIEESSF